MTIDVKAIFAEVQANHARLAGCPRHHFPAAAPFGKPWVCADCGGRMPAGDVLAYCDGFRAAGGDPRAVWASWAPWTRT